MRIVIIGSDYNWSIEQKYIRELEELGHSVVLLPAQNWFYEKYYQNILSKIIIRLGFSRIHSRINKKLIQDVDLHKPDLIWVFKGMEVFLKTLKLWRKQNYTLINYNPDNPFVFSGKGSGNKNVSRSVGLYDCYLSYDHQVLEQLKKQHIRTAFFPFAVDSCDINTLQNTTCIDALAFVGNPDAGRVALLNSLADKNIPIVVFGNNWNQFKLSTQITINGPVEASGFVQIAQTYRGMLNIMRVHNPDSHNMRSLEIPGYAGIQLAPYTKDHASFFEEDKEIFLFKNADEAYTKWQQMLQLSNEELYALRVRLVNKVKAQHSYRQRVNDLLVLINAICKTTR